MHHTKQVGFEPTNLSVSVFKTDAFDRSATVLLTIQQVLLVTNGHVTMFQQNSHYLGKVPLLLHTRMNQLRNLIIFILFVLQRKQRRSL